MATQSDSNSLYVLVSSLGGTVLSLVATWIFVAHSAQAMVAFCYVEPLNEQPRALSLSLPHRVLAPDLSCGDWLLDQLTPTRVAAESARGV
jgi:hypothetical protein